MNHPTPRQTDIHQWLRDHGEPQFRASQVIAAWWQTTSWEGVTTLSKSLRQECAQQFPWLTVEPAGQLVSTHDGTRKVVLQLPDQQRIESVCMPNARNKWTICLSSQVGCGMACTFCATGTMGLKRNLTVDEIVDQVRWWYVTHPEYTISNLVFMGMGEPLANYDNVKQAIDVLLAQTSIGPTRMTVSTVGILPGLNRLLHDTTFPPVRLALSLHAGTDETRAKIVPTHRGVSIADYVQWITQYDAAFGNRRHHVTLEYVLLAGVNDMPSEAQALVKHFQPIKHLIKLNLIPWNPTKSQLQRSGEDAIHYFAEITRRGGITTTVRYSKGVDIAAACGQLVVEGKA